MDSVQKWKPGDVIIHPDGLRGMVVTRGTVCKTHGNGNLLHVHYQDGDWDGHVIDEARLLVVLDPEDREQVERLALGYITDRGLIPPDPAITSSMQAALRELANPTPPKPDEPQGLGAVVEDADGFTWVRTHATGYPWHANLHPDDPNSTAVRKWEQVEAVRVLSEGIEAGQP